MPKTIDAPSEATLNVRMPAALKHNGDAVLKRNDLSVSQAVRELYEYLEKNQELPDCLASSTETRQQAIARKRALLKSMTGVVAPDVALDEIKAERLARQ